LIALSDIWLVVPLRLHQITLIELEDLLSLVVLEKRGVCGRKNSFKFRLLDFLFGLEIWDFDAG
jgi:hypothetical protein